MTNASAPDAPLDAPAPPESRVASIDILRGFALFGVLVVNMLLFAYPGFLYPALQSPGLSETDRLAEWVVRVFFQASFYTIFAFLFGLGFALQLRRLEASGGMTIYGRRLFVLFVVGLLHSLLLWTGDILHTYALVGFALLPFRKVRGRWLLLWGLLGLLLSLWLFWSPFSFVQALNIPVESRSAVIQSYAEGSYWEVTRTRLGETVSRFFGTLHGLPRFLALFMLGLWVGRRGIVQDAASHLGLIRWAAVLALALGVAGKAPYGYDLLTGDLGEASRPVRTLALNLSGPALGVAYLGGLLLLLQRPVWQRRLAPLAPVGRMALTNYLMQSVICTTLFYGYGLGLYGIGPAWALVIALIIYALQVPLSALWLAHFRFGPMEWLWRTLTYGRMQPLRHPAKGASPG